MLITKTARQKIENDTGYFGYTLSVYRDALQYVTKVVMGEWVNLIEKLIHITARSRVSMRTLIRSSLNSTHIRVAW